MQRRTFPIVLCIMLAAGLIAACDSTTAANLIAVIQAEAEQQAQSEPSVAAEPTAQAETPATPPTTVQPELPAGLQKMAELYGMKFVYVPAGEFTMGSTEEQVDAALEMCNAVFSTPLGGCDRAWFARETPQHHAYLDGCWIGQTETTNEQYRPFVEDGGYDDPSLWTEEGWQWREKSGITGPISWDFAVFTRPDQPVVYVSWYEAAAYTRWLAQKSGMDVRLPTEAEWEKAARGSDSRAFPWGEAPPDGSRVNYCDANCTYDWRDEDSDDGYAVLAPVGSYPAGVSPYGALDMAGNAWEWTSSKFKPYPYAADDGREHPEGDAVRILRGGSWDLPFSHVRCAFRYGFLAGGNDFYGFRVAAH